MVFLSGFLALLALFLSPSCHGANDSTPEPVPRCDPQQGLSSRAQDVSDGPCVFPKHFATHTNIFKLYSPMRRYYVPRASAAFYRMEYEYKNGGRSAPCGSTHELATLRPRGQMFTLRALSRLGTVEVTFDGGHKDTWYSFRCFPSAPQLKITSFLNATCAYVGGSEGVAPAPWGHGAEPLAHMAVMWSDGSAAALWGCFHGQQNWHIISTKPKLTAEQAGAAEGVLQGHGFNLSHAMDMKYN